jgi:AcrR family transcriptional regulator
MARRGAYAKGIAKREEILTTALDVIAREGYSGASIRQLADAVGLSQAGLLHYFDSKEELFAAVLSKRDEVDAVAFTREVEPAGLPEFLALVRHNAEVPGLVQLYVRMSAEATDPAHAGHAYFHARADQIRGLFEPAIRRQQELGRVPEDFDPARLARILVAVADGLQVQWLMDPTVDMSADIAALMAAIGIIPDDDAPEGGVPSRDGGSSSLEDRASAAVAEA